MFLATDSQPGESFIEVGIEVSLSCLRHYPTYIYGARALHPFFMCGQTFLVRLISTRGGTYHMKLVVYRASQDHFIEYHRRFQLFERLL